MELHLKVFEGLNPFQENAYLVYGDGKGHLFDPGFTTDEEWNPFLQFLEAQKIDLEAIVLTHAHVDHIMGLQEAVDRFKVPVYMHPAGEVFIHQFPEKARMYGMDALPITVKPQFIEPSPVLKIGTFEYDVRYTPGHAPGHLSFYHKKGGWVIVGDVLFAGSIGRTDLYGGNFSLLEESIKKEIYTLPDDTKVWPGHGGPTTTGHEKRTNPFVNEL